MDELTSTSPCILVVEEDDAVRRFLEFALAAQGFEILCAGSGVEGVQILQNDPARVNAVLMDVQMIPLDGPGALREMQRINPAVLCCFMTGDTSLSRSAELRQVGARHIFSKPFRSIPELARKLREVIAEGGAGSCSTDG